MSRATPRLRRLSRYLIACETRRTPSLSPLIPAAFSICGQLRPQLAPLMGNAGFRAFLSRTLAVAAVEADWLQGVRVDANGSLEWMAGTRAPVPPRDLAEGGVILMAQFLGLLIAFIGENLTFRILHEVWPELSADRIEFVVGNKNEDTQ